MDRNGSGPELAVEFDAQRETLAPHNPASAVVGRRGVEFDSESVRYLVREYRDQLHATVRNVGHRALVVRNSLSGNPSSDVAAPPTYGPGDLFHPWTVAQSIKKLVTKVRKILTRAWQIAFFTL